MTLPTARAWLAAALILAGTRVAPGQTVYTWNDANPNWATATNWTPTAPDWQTSGNNYIGLFAAQAAIANQPTVAAGDTVYALGVSVNNAGGASWNFAGGGTLIVQGTGLFAGGSQANAANVRGFDVYGGGTTAINVATRVGTSNQAWYATAGSRVVVNTALTGLVGTENLILRTASNSSWQFNAAAGAIGNVTLATTNGGTTARYELGADNVFGTNALAVTGGGGGGIVLRAVGADRVLGNSSTNFSNYNVTFDGTQSLTLAGAITFPGSTGDRTLTSNIVGGSAAFAGGIAIRSPTGADASATGARSLNLVGTGRFDIAGPVTNGGSVGGVGQLNQLLLGNATTAPTVRLSSAASDYTGRTIVNAGTLILGNDVGAAGAPSPLGAADGANATLTLGNLSGAADSAVLFDGAFALARGVNVRGTNTGLATIGGTAAAASTFSSVSVGTDPAFGGTLAKTLAVTSAAGGSVAVNSLSRFPNYVAAITVNKVGAGDATFGGSPADLNARLNVNAGTLTVGGDFSANQGVAVAAGATLTVNAGLTPGGSANALAVAGTLRGTGVVNHPVTVAAGASVAPGTPAALGTLTVAGQTVAFAANSNLAVRLAAPGAPAADALSVTGTGVLNVATGTNLVLSAAGFAPLPANSAAATYALGGVTNLQIDGTASGDRLLGAFVAGGGNAGGLPVTIDAGSLGLNAGDQLLFNYSGGALTLTYSPVPEPAGVLAVAALAGVAWRRRSVRAG